MPDKVLFRWSVSFTANQKKRYRKLTLMDPAKIKAETAGIQIDEFIV